MQPAVTTPFYRETLAVDCERSELLAAASFIQAILNLQSFVRVFCEVENIR